MKGFTFLLLLAACGGSSVPNRATVTGKVEGSAVTATNAAAIVVNSGAYPTVDVLISNAADGCGANAGNLKSKQVLSLGITAFGGTALAAGDYGVYDQASGNLPQGTMALVDYGSTNDGCADTTPPNTLGASGHVKLTSVSLTAGGNVQGEFDLFLQNGDHLKGTFDAPVCGDRPDGGADAGCH